MLINIIDSPSFFRKNVWSAQSFLPQRTLEIKDGYHMLKMHALMTERKETVMLTSNDTDVYYVGLENIEAQTGRLTQISPRQGNDIKSTCKRFCQGDVLYGRLRPNLNKVYYNDTLNEGVCTTEIFVLIPNTDVVHPVYFAELLRTTVINERIVGLIKGAALPRVSMSDFRQLELPLPPMTVQIQIAEEILEKRRQLESYIRIVQSLPAEMDALVTASFLK